MRAFLTSLIGSLLLMEAAAQDDRYIVRPDHILKSPIGTFCIEQRANDSKNDGWRWQTWICPSGKSAKPYQLKLWHDGELSWPGWFTVSPDENFIFHIQKTGSGENYAEVFAKGQDGRFRGMHKREPALSLSGDAWAFFTRITGVPETFYHAGVDFHGWEQDEESFAISLHGTDVNEKFYVRGWRLHYHLRRGKFSLTQDERERNRATIVYKLRPR